MKVHLMSDISQQQGDIANNKRRHRQQHVVGQVAAMCHVVPLMVCHGVSWCAMVCHGVPWCVMVCHGVLFGVPCGVPWCAVVCRDL
jgi:hypothetical protein